MNKFRVYMTETVEFSYDVEAESPDEARDKVYNGDYDAKTHEAWDSYNFEIIDVQEMKDEQ